VQNDWLHSLKGLNEMKTIKLVIAYSTLALGLGLTTVHTQAQQLYRIVGPDGKVTFSDQPPPSADAKVTVGRGGRFASDAQSNNQALPFELRESANKFPVTLYTGKDCDPCSSARNALNAHGIPFNEKTIESTDDVEAYRKFGSIDSLPLVTIGGKQLAGFNENEWAQYLDAAGYPKTSILPASYRKPAAVPMVAKAAATTASAPQAVNPTRASTATAPARNPSNPAGIKF
jgi:glutaredoxin